MKPIDIGSVHRWRTLKGPALQVPAVIGSTCGSCHSLVSFTTAATRYDALRQTVTCSARCPSCREITHFWVLGVRRGQRDINGIEVFMRPVPDSALDSAGPLHALPDETRGLLNATIDACNAHNHVAVNVLFARTLQSLLHHRLPEGATSGKPGRLLKDVAAQRNFAEPLMQLRTALPSVQDAQAQQPEERARAQVKLLTLMVDYLYRTPDALKDTISTLDASCD